MAKLEVAALTKEYRTEKGTFSAVKDINFSMTKGEFLSIVGPSGCGKSTILNMIAGLEAPTSGVIRVDGKSVSGPGRDRGMVFQKYTLFPWRRVKENIWFGLELRGVSHKERERIALHFVDIVNLEGFENAYPNQLSGGMQQRVAIARALANEPEVLLMDEPFGALDPQTRHEMQLHTLGVQEKLGCTIVFITHDIDEAVLLADRVLVMAARPGRIIGEFRSPRYSSQDLSAKVSDSFVKVKERILALLNQEIQAGATRLLEQAGDFKSFS